MRVLLANQNRGNILNEQITNVERLFRQTNSKVEKRFYESLKSRSP